METRGVQGVRLGCWSGSTLAAFFLSFLQSGCEHALEDPISAVNNAAQRLEPLFSLDFEQLPLGNLGPPWLIRTNNSLAGSTIGIVLSGDPVHGKVMLLDGSAADSDFLSAGFGFTSFVPEIHLQVDVMPDLAAPLLFALSGEGPAITGQRIRLYRLPGATELWVNTSPSGNTRCGTLPSDRWSRLSLRIRTQQIPHVFDVLIDGAPTACTELRTAMGPPFRAVSILDAPMKGWGGRVSFDNLMAEIP